MDLKELIAASSLNLSDIQVSQADKYLNQIISSNSLALLNDGTFANRNGNNVNISDRSDVGRAEKFFTNQVISQYQR